MEENEQKQQPTDAQVEQEKLEHEYMMDTGSGAPHKGPPATPSVAAMPSTASRWWA